MMLDESIRIMTDAIVAELGDNALSVYLYGSVVLDDFRLGWSDIDILVLTKAEIPADKAEMLVELRQALFKRYPDNPYFRSFEGCMCSLDAFHAGKAEHMVYWGTSGQRVIDSYYFDSFSMAELLDHGILLHGGDVRDRFSYPNYSALRDDVRKHYETIRKHAQTTGKSIVSYGWLLDIARSIYTLRTGSIIAKTAAGEWAMEHGVCPVPDALAKAIEVRRAPLAAKADESVLEYAEQLSGEIQTFADVLELELYQRLGR